MLADLHLHFEGSVPLETLLQLARKNGHSFGIDGAFDTALARSSQSGSFLRLFADCCRVFQSPEDYAEAARAVGRELARELRHAEIYVSPEIWTRFGLDRAAVLAKIDRTLAEVEKETGARFPLLLDSVRQWGSEAAQRVLDFFEENRIDRIVGFGIGGDESSVPAREFRKVYERARRLGLSTTVHAGEWAGPESVSEALGELSPDRIDHGVRAVENPRLLARMARSGVTLCVAPSSNIATGVAESWKKHPLPKLLDAGVSVCLSADDPTIFGTTTIEEYRRARAEMRVTADAVEEMQKCAWKARFGK
jgi:adenosine deaminase